MKGSTGGCSAEIAELKAALCSAEAVVIGAGAGLSTSAGFACSGRRFEEHFGDFAARYGFQDMYAGGFYPYETPEEQWGYWCRYIYLNRYEDPPLPVYQQLLALMKDKDYFVLTTNVDHCFQKAGFDKEHLFYTQGDYGLFQCSAPCRQETWDNRETVFAMMKAEGYQEQEGRLFLPAGRRAKMTVPAELVPRCPRCGRPAAMNLRADDTFAEDAGWQAAADRYIRFLQAHQQKSVLFWEIGTGFNTPGIIKFPFWQITADWPQARYACLNKGQAGAPEELTERAICIDADAGEVIRSLSE